MKSSRLLYTASEGCVLLNGENWLWKFSNFNIKFQIVHWPYKNLFKIESAIYHLIGYHAEVAEKILNGI